MSQLALPLAWASDPADDAFLVSPSNAEAVRLLDRPDAWPVRVALLVGPPRSGRSTLARLFARRHGGFVVDDAQAAPEGALFTAWNEAQAGGRPTVFVAAALPPAWRVALPDLASRLAACPRAAIEPPDDQLVRALFERGFDRCRLALPPDLADWLVARIERSHAAVEAAVLILDRAVTERQRRLSIPLARTLLGDGSVARPEDP